VRENKFLTYEHLSSSEYIFNVWVSLIFIRVWMSVMFYVWMNLSVLFCARMNHERHVPRMNESYHTHETNKSLWSSAVSSSLWFMCSVSHTNESCCAWGWVTSHASRSSSWYTVVSPSLSFRCVTYEWVKSGVWMMPHVDESWHTHQEQFVVSHHLYIIQVCRVWSMNELCHMYEWVVSCVRMSRDTHTSRSGSWSIAVSSSLLFTSVAQNSRCAAGYSRRAVHYAGCLLQQRKAHLAFTLTNTHTRVSTGVIQRRSTWTPAQTIRSFMQHGFLLYVSFMHTHACQ